MTKVFLVCSGLGTIRRGYEAFMRECFYALQGEPSLDVWLFKGAGAEGPREVPLRNLHRGSIGARLVGELFNRGVYTVEQATLTLSLLPHLRRERPELVYYCDPTIGRLLWQWRRLGGLRYRLLLHNGGPHQPPHRWCDHVHQLTPGAMEDARAAGQPAGSQTLLPCGFRFALVPQPPRPEERAQRRAQLGMPEVGPVVLAVGALNRGHKRMDYLINEIASLPSPRPYLVMLGEVESETQAVRATADLLLGHGGFMIRSVRREEVGRYYRAADLFVLASLREAFGLVFVEAMAQGLPCLAHDYPVSRFVLGEEGLFADLSQPGALATLMTEALARPDTMESRTRRHHAVRSRFGWNELTPHYAAMLHRAATAGAPTEVESVPLEAGAPAH